MISIQTYIIGCLVCFASGAIMGWALTVVNWRIKQTDYEIRYRHAKETLDEIFKGHPVWGKQYEERGR